MPIIWGAHSIRCSTLCTGVGLMVLGQMWSSLQMPLCNELVLSRVVCRSIVQVATQDAIPISKTTEVGGSKGTCTKFKMAWENFTRSVATLPCLAADCSLHAHPSKPHSHPMFVLLLRILDPQHSHGLCFFSLLFLIGLNCADSAV